MTASRIMMKLFDWHGQDSRATGPLDIAHAVTAQYGTGGGNAPMIVHEQTICRANSQSHAGTMVECAPCLSCDHEAPILKQNCLNAQDNQSRRIYNAATGPAPALAARETAGGDQTGAVEPNETQREYPAYIVRRLIPLECSRLQGFPDGWGEIAPLDVDNEAEIDFWRGVYRTDCALKNKRANESILRDPRRMARWHDGLHSISAEYRMWGNGMALPNALFFVRRAIDQIVAETGKTPTEIKLGSLFDGSGTMPLAAEMCGSKAVWASEVEPYPIAVTRTHLPYMKHLGSVIDIDGGEIEPVDIITFGSPRQDLSIAGKRAGLSGARSGLFMQAVRIIREMWTATGGKYPRFAIWENVPGALSSNKGEDFGTVINELLGIARPDDFIRGGGKWPNAQSYGAIAWRIVNAQYWGVPQRRRRIYLVTDFSRESAGMVAFERKGAPWRFDPRVPSGERVAALATDCYQWHDRMVAGKSAGGGSCTLKIRSGCEGGGKGPLIQEEKSATLATHTDQTLFTYGFSGQAGPGAGMTATEETSPTLKVKQIENVAVGFMAGQGAKARSVGAAVEVSPTLKACASGLNQIPSVISLMGNIIDREVKQNGTGIKTDGTSYTLDTISRHGVAYKNKTSEEAK